MSELDQSLPGEQVQNARDQTHRAVQLIARAAAANLAQRPDDSQSSLRWDRPNKAFFAEPVPTRGDTLSLSLRFTDFSLHARVGTDRKRLVLHDRHWSDALAFVDATLEENGLAAASTCDLPYELPDAVSAIDRFDVEGCKDQFTALARWYDLTARLLDEIADGCRTFTPGPSPVRCWPHHFDIATYIQLEIGGAEVAKGVGVGLSPGDSSYDQPYFYVNPWPSIVASELPLAPTPGHWHTDGFVGLIATAEEVFASTAAVETASRSFLTESMEMALRLQGF